MASCDANIVVASMDVELGVDLCTAKLVEEVCDEGDQVLILPSDIVKVSEVNTESKLRVLPGVEHEGGGLCRGMDSVIIDELGHRQAFIPVILAWIHKES